MLYNIGALISGSNRCLTGTEISVGLVDLFPFDTPPHTQRNIIKPIIERYLKISSPEPSFVAIYTFDPQQVYNKPINS